MLTLPAPRRLIRIAAPIAAMTYPAWIACASRISPVFLIVALGVPVAGLIAARELARDAALPRARAVAHLAVAAPALFSFLGGWLDFQHAIPLDSVRIWIPWWAALGAVAWLERPGIRAPTTGPVGRRLAFAHGASATVIAVFATAHLVNHLGGLWGGDVHTAIMDALRSVYRLRLVETVLLVAVAFQVGSGAVLLWRKLRSASDGFETLQTVSGAYLLVFLLSHVGAVLRARGRGVDTGWPWISEDLLTDPWLIRLPPYYWLAVVALGVHAGSGLRTILIARGARRPAAAPVLALGALATLAAVLILVGLLR